MGTRAEGAKNVAAVELRGGQKVEGGGEEADPGGAANGRKEQAVGVDARVKERVQQAEEQRSAEDHVRLRRIGMDERGDDGGMHNAVNERGNSENKSYERTGGTHVEESACGANGRTDEDERAESANEGRKRNEEGIRGADVMKTAGEEMAELVGEKNEEKSGSEGEASEKSGGILVEEREGLHEFI